MPTSPEPPVGTAEAARRLEEIRARAEAATPGPWEYSDGDSIGAWTVYGDGWALASIEPGTPPPHLPESKFPRPRTSEQADRDGPFIAHAREDIPWLLAEIERGRAAISDLRALQTAAEALADVPHVLQVHEDGWGLQHPLRCRPALTDCLVHARMAQLYEAPAPVGQYRVSALGAVEGPYTEPDPAQAFLEVLARLRSMEGGSG